MTPSTAAGPGAGPRGPAQGRVPHPSVTERAARGDAVRAGVPQSSHADWQPSAGRRAPEDVLLEQAADRVPELVPVRHARMLAFVRGATAPMAGDLAATPQSRLPAQLCGYVHLSNFGGFATPDRELPWGSVGREKIADAA